MWVRSLGQQTNTDDMFNQLNKFKKEFNKLKSRKSKIVNTIQLVKTL